MAPMFVYSGNGTQAGLSHSKRQAGISLSELIIQLEGTPAGELLALALALLSALAHAILGAIHKSGIDPFLNRGAVNITFSVIAAPFALFVVPWPSAELFGVLAIAFLVHLAYELLQATSFQFGAFTLVYPIARGTGPLITAFLALLVFGERLEITQWMGLLLLSGAILSLAWANLRAMDTTPASGGAFVPAIAAALLTGVMIAVYTIVDAYGIRLASDPFAFLAWFFFIGGFGSPVYAYWRWLHLAPGRRPPIGDLAARGLFGALLAYVSFGAIMLATRLGNVGEAAAIREVSIIFATGIGVLIFREKIDLTRIVIIGLIVAGAVLVEFH